MPKRKYLYLYPAATNGATTTTLGTFPPVNVGQIAAGADGAFDFYCQLDDQDQSYRGLSWPLEAEFLVGSGTGDHIRFLVQANIINEGDNVIAASTYDLSAYQDVSVSGIDPDTYQVQLLNSCSLTGLTSAAVATIGKLTIVGTQASAVQAVVSIPDASWAVDGGA